MTARGLVRAFLLQAWRMGESAHFFLLVFLLVIIAAVEKPIEDGEIFQVFPHSARLRKKDISAEVLIGVEHL